MSETTLIRDRDGSLTETTTDTETRAHTCHLPEDARTVRVNGRDVLRPCLGCKPHLAGLPSVAERAAGHGFVRRRRLAVVR